ncbi:ras and EF-hand domain-containing protein homolog [Oppia nitens]|uniref:ras and EF-hand domain-containing protein homolog n=1 Tax=Oppia nitens TaxID=1686743 RepID=UPI0023DBDC9A|nr:ras and EF-hand domain-containing protein homolog [Oppia nitens]
MNTNNSNDLMDQNLRQVFNYWDTDRSGYLCRDELRELCARFNIKPDDSDGIFDDLDRDSDGRISFDDFRTGFDDYEKGLIITDDINHNDNNNNSNNTSECYGNLKKALETEDITEKFAENVYKPKKMFIQNDCNTSTGFSEHYISEPQSDQQNDQSVIEKLLESVRELQEENKRLANSWIREKKEHEKHLFQLEQEVDYQVKEAENRVQEKAKKEVEAEKKSMRDLMKGEMEELQSHLNMFEKVETWLKTNHQNLAEDQVNEIRAKLDESMQDSRQLKLSLVDTQTSVALMRTELAQLRLQYDHKCRELTTQMSRFSEQQSEQQHLQQQLMILQEANKRLNDTNDALRNVLDTTSLHSMPSSPEPVRGCHSVLSHHKRGSVIGDYINNDGQHNKDRHVFSRLSETEVDFESVSMVSATDRDAISYRSFASCPPISAIKHIVSPDDMDSGLSSMMNRSHRSSPLLMSYYKRSDSSKNDTTVPLNTTNTTTATNITSHSISNMISEPTGPPERTYKVIFIGDASVGKSTYILRLSKGYFAAQLSTTLGVDFQVRTFSFDGRNVALQLWDTAGQERYRSITRNYFRKADGIMLLYDVTNEQTFLNVRDWIYSIEEVTAKGVPVMIVGNKVDLRPTLQAQDMKYVKAEDGYKMAQQFGLMFVETSCKDGMNIMSSIAQLTQIMTQNEDNLIQSALTLSSDGKPKRFGCCSK